MKLITKIGPMCGDAVKITNSFHGAVDLRSKDTPCHCLPWTNNSYNSDAHIENCERSRKLFVNFLSVPAQSQIVGQDVHALHRFQLKAPEDILIICCIGT